MKENTPDKLLTRQQQKALYTYFTLLAETLNEAGLDQRIVLKPSVLIPWTKKDIHDKLWCEIQNAYIKEYSTTKLKRTDIDKIFDILNRHLVEKFGEFCEFPFFPSIETEMFKSEYDKHTIT